MKGKGMEMDCRIRLIFFTACVLFYCAVPGFAQIETDGSVGPSVALNGPDFRIGSELGALAGDNLFHSFEIFNITRGESATFTGPNSVANIIGRITGGSSSLINGALYSEIHGANLYLLNPAGFMFGSEASLNITGSFHAGSADYLDMGENGRFSALPEPGEVLSSADPAAFGFLDEYVAAIDLENSYLEVPDGKTLSMAGDIAMNGGNLRAQSGRIDISGNTLSLSNGAVISTSALGEGRGGDISISATESVTISGAITQNDENALSGLFVAAVDENAGNVRLSTPVLSLDSLGTVCADTYGPGDAGTISLEVNTLALSEGARISSGTWGRGSAGTIDVEADESIRISGGINLDGQFYPSGIVAHSIGRNSGNAGDISLVSRDLELGGGAIIDASSEGYGPGGNILVDTYRPDRYPNGEMDVSSLYGADGSIVFLSNEAGDIIDEISAQADNLGETVLDAPVLEEAGFEYTDIGQMEMDAYKSDEDAGQDGESGSIEIQIDGKTGGERFGLSSTGCGETHVGRLKFKDKYSAPVSFKGFLSYFDDYPLPASRSDSGDDLFDEGEFGQAIRVWENMPSEPVIALKIARAFNMLGFQTKAAGVMKQYSGEVMSEPDSPEKAVFLCTLANQYIALGEFSHAAPLLKQSGDIATGLKDECLTAAVLNETGNALAASGREYEAEGAYRKSTSTALSAKCPSKRYIRTLVNMAILPSWENRHYLEVALPLVVELPEAYRRTRDLLSIGTAGIKIGADKVACDALATAMESCENYPGLRHYVFGYLGGIYEKKGLRDEALNLTRKALFYSDQFYPESRYLWEWQMARLLQTAGNGETAEAYYRKTFKTLTPIRHKLYSDYKISTDIFDLEIKPVYLGMADFFLKKGKIENAVKTMEILKHVELREFFLDECVTRNKTGDGSFDMPEGSVMVYPILFPDRIAIILKFENHLKMVEHPVDSKTVRDTVDEFMDQLQDLSVNSFLITGKSLYDWIIAPISSDLEKNAVDTLVFAPDGVLRLVPFAALFDGDKFLVEKYAMANIPGLSLVNRKTHEKSGILIVGISESVQNFNPLPAVPKEIAEIQKITETDFVLQNAEYTLENISKELSARNVSTVHIATHGVFGGSLKDSFLLTYDSKLGMDGLESLISSSPSGIDLLAMSACQTAVGNERAALGMAGTAVKAGVESVLATLWSVNDMSTSLLVAEFYKQAGNEGVSKAGALQAAQKKLIGTDNYWKPFYWASFLLIGNWR